MAVTRAQLAKLVQRKNRLDLDTTAALIESVLAEIASALERGENVLISGFGNFEVRHKGYRLGRNPRTGQAVPIGSHRAVTFRPSRVLKDRMAGSGADYASALATPAVRARTARTRTKAGQATIGPSSGSR
jgi:integration host factor subunit alpha